MANERNLSQEIDDLKTMMLEQGTEFRKILEVIIKTKEDNENNDPHDQPGYESGNDNNPEMEREVERLKLKEELEKEMQA